MRLRHQQMLISLPCPILQKQQLRRLRFANLKTSIIDSSTFSASGPNIPLIITGLNAYDTGTGNALKASQLYSGGAYRDASYFLTYANIAGTPTVPADVKDLTNTTGYVRFQGAVADSGNGLVWSGAGADNTGNSSTISTSNIPEGTNQYYTLARGAEAVVANFGTQFNIYNSTFDKGDVRDSLDAEAATFVEPYKSLTDKINLRLYALRLVAMLRKPTTLKVKF